MRLDKFLWNVRLFKTRTLASKACSENKVQIDGSFSKPKKEVIIGNILSIKNIPIWRSYKILNIPTNRIGAKLVQEFIEETTSAADLTALAELQDIKRINHKLDIKGRPTKKLRRDIDRFKE